MLLFSYQCPYRIVSFLRTILFVICQFLADSLLIISHIFFFVKNFFKFFSNHFCDTVLFFDNEWYVITSFFTCQQFFSSLFSLCFQSHLFPTTTYYILSLDFCSVNPFFNKTKNIYNTLIFIFYLPFPFIVFKRYQFILLKF